MITFDIVNYDTFCVETCIEIPFCPRNRDVIYYKDGDVTYKATVVNIEVDTINNEYSIMAHIEFVK